MNFRMLGSLAARRRAYWAGFGAALLGIVMITVVVVKLSSPGSSEVPPPSEFPERLVNRVSGTGSGIEEAQTPPEPSGVAAPETAPTSVAAEPRAALPAKAASGPAHTPAPPSQRSGDPSDPLTRYNFPAGPDGRPYNPGGPDVRCDIWNNVPPVVLQRGQTYSMGCQVISVEGFSAPTAVSCGEPTNRRPLPFDVDPSRIPCSFNPPVVTPPSGGSAPTTLSIQIPQDLPYDSYSYGFKVDSPGAQLYMPPVKPFNFDIPRPDFAVDCGAGSMTIAEGEEWADLVCQVSVPPAFEDAIEIVHSGAYTDPDRLELVTDVDRLEFPPHGGSAQFLIRARAGFGGAGSYSEQFMLRNASRTSLRFKNVPVTIEVRDTPSP